MAVVRKSNSFRDWTDEVVRDPEILRLARRVRLCLDEQVQAVFPAKRL